MKPHGILHRAAALRWWMPGVMMMVVLACAPLLLAEPVLTYRNQGARSPFGKVEITISETGDTRVALTKHQTARAPYETKLSAEELAGLDAVMDAVEFFGQPDTDPRTASSARMHAGGSELSYRQGGRSRTLSFVHRETMLPVVWFLYKLVHQADAVNELVEAGDPGPMLRAVSPQMAGGKVLQPQAMKEPLLAFVRKAEEQGKLRAALDALVWITTPEEFLGIISAETRKERGERLLPVAYTSRGTPAHVEMICHFRHAWVRDHHGRQDLTKEQQEALERMIRALQNDRHRPCLPMFAKWFEENRRLGMELDVLSFGFLGEDSLRAILPYLEREELYYRCNAAELLRIVSRSNPKGVLAFPVAAHEYARMIPVFQQQALPKLRAMAAEATDPRERKAAADAVAEIELEVGRE